MKRRIAWTALVVTLGAIVAAAWLLPERLDWNRYRSTIAALAAETLGRQVRIEGPIALSVFPQPMLTAGTVTVGDGRGTPEVTAGQLQLKVALGPLLAGRIDAQELVLRGVDVALPWPVAPDALVFRTPSWLSALSARIEDGRLSIGGLVFTGVDATLTTDDDTGTYRVAGTARQSGRDWRFTLRLTRPGGDGSAGLDVTLDGLGPVQGVGASVSGQIVADGSMVGRIAARGPDLSQLLPAPPVAFRAEGRLDVAAGLAVADELNVELGGSPARGAVALRVLPAPRLDVALTASRLDLDAWLAALTHVQAENGLPGLPTGIDLSAEAGQLAGGTLRGLRGAFDLADGVVVLRELRATLPGDAALRVSGRLRLGDGGSVPPQPPRFEGEAAVTAAAPRPTIAWVQEAWLRPAGLALPDALPEVLQRSLDLAGHLVVQPGQVMLTGLQGTLDGGGVAGSIGWRRRGAVEPAAKTMALRWAVEADLRLDQVDFGAGLPRLDWGRGSRPGTLNDVDFDLKLAVKQALLGGTAFGPVGLEAASEAGRLTLRRLDAAVAGGQISASGGVAEGRLVDGRVDVQAPQAGPLLEALPASLGWFERRFPGLGRLPLRLRLQGAGVADRLGLSLLLDLGDLRIEGQPMLDLLGGKASGTLTLRHPGAPRLLEALGVPGAAAWLGDGSLSLVAQLAVMDGRVAAESFDITAGALRGSGALSWQRDGAGDAIAGRLVAETLPLPLPYLRSPEPLPLAALAGVTGSVRLEAAHVLVGLSPAVEQLATTVVLSEAGLRLDGLTAKLGGGGVQGSAAIDLRARPPVLSLSVRLAGARMGPMLFDTPIDLGDGTLDGEVALQAAGYSPAALLATLAGSLRLAARDGVFTGVAMGSLGLAGAGGDAAVERALAGGATPFASLDILARVAGGTLTLSSGVLAGPSGQIDLAGSIDLPGAAADLRLGLHPKPPEGDAVPGPEIGLRLNGAFDALHRTPELADLTRWRAARATQ